VSGSRRDHYKANTNIKELVLRRMHEGILRRLDMVEQRLKNIGERFDASGSGKEQELLKKRAAEIKSMVDKGRTALNMLPKILGMFT
jgi:DNA-binding transcriptional regulator GbsR (MarR family)